MTADMYHKAMTTHGAFTANTRRRYSDGRTEEGKRLKAVRESLVESLGGPDVMTAAQALILAGIESKLVILWTISDYVDQQANLVDSTSGELLPCLNRNFIAYSESLRRDIETFYSLNRFQLRQKRLPKIEDLIKANKDSESKVDLA